MNEQILTRYLLGELPEDEQAKIEEQLFRDDAAFEQARALKAELTDHYVRGNLSARERRRYEQRFLTSPAGRYDAQFAKALTRVLEETEPVGERAIITEPKPSWWESIAAFFRVPAFGLGLAMAALLLLLGSVWFYQQTQRLQTEVQQANAAREAEARKQQELQTEIARAKTRNDELNQQLQQAQQERDQARKELEQAAPTPSQSPTATLLTMFLRPILRASNERERVVLPSGATKLQIQLVLDANDNYRRYRVELYDARERLVASQDNLQPRSTATGATLFYLAPAQGLARGNYEITLKGITDTGEMQNANYYYFTVVRR